MTVVVDRNGLASVQPAPSQIRGLLTKTRAWARILCNLAGHPRCIAGAKRAAFLGDRETLAYLAMRPKGIVRFGDGEAGYLAGYSYPHQRQDEVLRRRLIAILRDYDDDSSALVAIPHDLVYGCNYAARKTTVEYWRAARWVLRPYIKDRMTYGSAFCFRAGLAIDHDLRSYGIA